MAAATRALADQPAYADVVVVFESHAAPNPLRRRRLALRALCAGCLQPGHPTVLDQSLRSGNAPSTCRTCLNRASAPERLHLRTFGAMVEIIAVSFPSIWASVPG